MRAYLGEHVFGLLLDCGHGVTTRPERWARMTGSTARVTFTGPNTVVSICARSSSGVISSKNPA
jgi:hypothetical protein